MQNSILRLIWILPAILSTAFYSYAHDSIIVTGEVKNILPDGSRTLIINECDPGEKSERRVVSLDSTEVFREEIPLAYPHTFTINYTRGNFINLFAEPGDSIHISIDASKAPFTYHLTGDKARFNEQYAHACQDLNHLLYTVDLPKDSVDSTEFMSIFKREYKRVTTELDKYIAKNNIDQDVASLLRIGTLFDMSNMTLDYWIDRSAEDRIAFITDDVFDLLNPDNTKLMIFPYHISSLGDLMPEFITSLPKSTLRDIMYAMEAEYAGQLPSPTDFYNEGYYDRIFEKNDKGDLNLTKIPDGNFFAYKGGEIAEIENRNVLEWIKDFCKGKTAYLDVSATWCGPCRNAIKGSQSIRKHFEGTDVVFVILWLKSDIETWKKLAPTIDNAVQVFVNDDDTSNLIIGALGVNGFPTYKFINRDGSMVSEDVPHFMNPYLIEYLQLKSGL